MSLWISSAASWAAPWVWVDDPVFGALEEWTNEVEIGDLDADGDLDVILANGGGYSSGGTPEPSWWMRNDGTGQFVAIELTVGLHRTAKVRDLDADGLPDLLLPGAWGTPSLLLLGDGSGGLVDNSSALPPGEYAFGDAEPGDVDGDGDLDIVLTDSGPQNALFSDGGVSRLWLNDGSGTFTDATDAQMPPLLVPWSWDIELVDIDTDMDLDLLVSCKTCANSLLLTNDGAGNFADRTATALPSPRSNNYDFEALDLTGDGLPDLVTINDGPGLDERILINDGVGAFIDETDARLPPDENIGKDDNVAVMLDEDQDGDIDILIGSLSGADRLLINDGTGHFVTDEAVIEGPGTPGTLALAAGDFDGDGRLDLVMGQGESAESDRWYRGQDLPPDTLGPVVTAPSGLSAGAAPSLPLWLSVAAHDRKTPVIPDDLTAEIQWTVGEASGVIPLRHAGGSLWRGLLEDLPAGLGTAITCATDRSGNESCSEPVAFGMDATDTGAPTETGIDDTGLTPTIPGEPKEEGCRCSGGAARLAGGELLVLLALWRRSRTDAQRATIR